MSILELAPTSALAGEAQVQLNLGIDCLQTAARIGCARAQYSLVRRSNTTREYLSDLLSGDGHPRLI
jgi:hypothetical protein